MGWEAWLLAGLIVSMLGLLATGRYGADIIFLGALTVLLVSGILTAKEAIVGFASPGVVTVGMLYVVAAGLKETGGLTILSAPLLGRPKSDFAAQSRVMLPVAILSAFVNNTPIVAMFISILGEWCRRNRLNVSRLLLPLSYATILGGCCTLIGTSTNLVVKSLVDDYIRAHPAAADAQQLTHFTMFTQAPVGVIVAAFGLTYILLFGRRLLPVRAKDVEPVGETKQYDTAMLVEPSSPIVGRTVEQAGLRHLPGLYLSRIEREDTTIIAVSPSEVIRAGDTLVFVGVLESVKDVQKIRGLTPVGAGKGVSAVRQLNRLIEVVVSPASPLVGQSIRDARFRTNYGAVVLAVHRMGERLLGKLGDITMRPGDTLLLEAPVGWAARHRDSSAFLLVSEHEGSAAPRHERAWASIVILLLLVLGLTFARQLGVDEMTVAMAAAALMILMRCCTGPQARRSVDWQVLLVIAAAFGVGRAMESTGLAATIADVALGWAIEMGPTALLAAIYAITLFFTTFITNNAAAVLMFPIAVKACDAAGVTDFTPYAISIALAASLEFMTPLGYQTNLMVMGPGGYKWLDYLRFGGPLTILSGIVAVIALAMM